MLLPLILTGPTLVGLPTVTSPPAWAVEPPAAQETATPQPPAATDADPDAAPPQAPRDESSAEPSEAASPEAKDRAAAPAPALPAAPADGIADLTGTGSWVAVGQKWQWRGKDGSITRSRWARINGAIYRFDDDGNMVTGWWKDGKSWYHLADSGARSTGWVQVAGSWYYLSPTTGIMATGELVDGGSTYLLRSDGAMVTGWLQQADGWRFYHPSGARAHGWVQDAGTWYYLSPTTGVMATGWLRDGGSWFYLHGSGAMATGWLQVGGSWFYLHGSGAMATGWLKDGATWYYLDPGTGAMVTGTRTINGNSQSFAPSGAWIGYRAPSGYLQPVDSVTPLGWSTNTLTWGMNGVKVRIVQQRLGLWHSRKLASVDSSFVSAVKNFQRRVGLPQTGVVDESTWWVDQHQEVPTSLSATRGERIETMIGYAWNQTDSSYTWGGAGPYGLGFDCSGLVLQSLYKAGLDPQPINVIKHGWPDYRSSQELYKHPQMMHVPLSQRQRGDLIFYTTDGVVTHVAIYLGGDQVIHTDWMGRPARIDHITVTYGWGNMTSDVVRPFP